MLSILEAICTRGAVRCLEHTRRKCNKLVWLWMVYLICIQQLTQHDKQ